MSTNCISGFIDFFASTHWIFTGGAIITPGFGMSFTGTGSASIPITCNMNNIGFF